MFGFIVKITMFAKKFTELINRHINKYFYSTQELFTIFARCFNNFGYHTFCDGCGNEFVNITDVAGDMMVKSLH
jgi:hypothetical protein